MTIPFAASPYRSAPPQEVVCPACRGEQLMRCLRCGELHAVPKVYGSLPVCHVCADRIHAAKRRVRVVCSALQGLAAAGAVVAAVCGVPLEGAIFGWLAFFLFTGFPMLVAHEVAGLSGVVHQRQAARAARSATHAPNTSDLLSDAERHGTC